MNRKNLFFLFLVISLNCIICETDDCYTDFENVKKSSCVNLLYGNNTHTCTYSDNKCEVNYLHCTDYTGTDQDVCKKINPSDPLKKCKIVDNHCTEVYRICEDSKGESDCFELKVDEKGSSTGQRCLYYQDKCKAYYDSCSDIKNANIENKETTCNNNIPMTVTSTCLWDQDDCKEQENSRVCSDYEIFGHIDETNSPSRIKQCYQFKAPENYQCVIYGKTCKAVYAGCENWSVGKGECKDYFPINSHSIVPNKKCNSTSDGSGCTEIPKLCHEYNEDFDQCISLITTINDVSKKICVLDNNNKKCTEKFTACAAYNSVISDSTKRTENECTQIVPQNDIFKCVFDKADNTCNEKRKKCEDFTSSQKCEAYIPELDNKKCIWKNNKCIEVYKTCSDYNSNVNANDKNAADCQAIIENSFTKCVYFENNKTCVSKERNCSDYEAGQDKYNYCTSIGFKSNNIPDNNFGCAYDNGKCIYQYKSCSSYEGNDTKICESIIATYPKYSKCALENDKTCTEVSRHCSEYTGNSDVCSYYEPSDTSQYICALVDNKCIEQRNAPTQKIYSYCSDYRGKDKSICESISSHLGSIATNEYTVYYSTKCSFEDERCVRKEISCNEVKTVSQCKSIVLKNTRKHCVFVDGRCKEQYRTCTDYNNDEDVEVIDRTTCEGIVSEPCAFSAPTSQDQKGTCTSRAAQCSDFRFELLQLQCALITPTNRVVNKCVYNNGYCKTTMKNCKEIDLSSSLESAKEKLCESAPTTGDNKKCVYDSSIDSDGCQEIDKPKEEPQNPDNDDEQNKEDENTGREIYLKYLVIFILFLLF